MSLPPLLAGFCSPKKTASKSPCQFRSKETGYTRRMRMEPLECRCAPSGLGNLATDFSFNALDRFALFAMSGSKVDITNPSTELGGDVGLGPHSTQNFSDGKIDVDLLVDPTANNTHSNNVVIVGHTYSVNLAPDNADALDAASVVAALTPTRTLGNITGSTTLTSKLGNNVINVISVNAIQLDGSSTLTLQGNSSDYFFINVTGKYAQTGTSAIKLTGGLQETHVLFNILGTGEQVAFTGSSVGEGTYLAVNRDVSVSGAKIDGVLIGGMNHQIAITSGAKVQVNAPHFVPPVV
jgi:hypothetical protein